MRRSSRGLIAAALAVTVVSGCGASTNVVAGDGRAPSGSGVVVAHGLEALPSQSLSDWVSYSTQVSVVEVVSEREAPRDPAIARTGEGSVNRELQLRVLRTIWTSPETQPRTGQVEYLADGWVVGEQGRREMHMDGATRERVGRTYLIPFTDFGDGQWGPMAGSASVPVVDGVVRIDPGQENPTAKQLDGLTVEEVEEQLRSARPDAAAQRHRGLPPIERYRAVLRDRGQGGDK